MSKIADLLQTEYGLTPAEIEKAAAFQRKYGGQLESVLVSMGALSSESLPGLYANLLRLPIVQEERLVGWTLPEDARQLPLAQLLEHHWLPFDFQNNTWTILTPCPTDMACIELLSQFRTDFQVMICSNDQFSLLRNQVELTESTQLSSQLSSSEEARLRELASEAPTVNLLNSLITRALRLRASDMHVEPVNGKGIVRFRVDGVLHEVESIPAAILLPVITRLKILSSMDIAEKRRPQDGKIETKISGVDLDIRVSALPLADGESVVMRFLRKDNINYDLADLGISADIETQILEDITTTAGVILLTGPTGSGKTTSLYTFLNRLNTPQVKIITLEDPVEYQLNGVNQVQVQPDIGFDFAAGLRSVVRQDPDIIMLGEIRDKETAAVAMQSALTGHLVFSTVHTNDAPSAYTRLLDLGVDEFLLNAALVSIIAQRLARRLCPHCAQPDTEHRTHIRDRDLHVLAQRFGLPSINLKVAKGCEHCSGTGYRGRVALIEYLRCDDAVRSIPKDQNFIREARQLNSQRGVRNLLEDGLLKAMQGVTTVEEVLRVAG
ncbi:GspE/PulE family protein [Rheinheimera texasensis]|uniref:GspE/PulE family protein n=1 Tax=Rheinheimera texasensis TaxID=306205 RepID=UPI0004E112CA|nr:GspE/PulE family protein [Rheinheimera texasensis]